MIRAHLFPNYLSEAEIGVLALLVSYGSIFAQIAILGFNHAAIRYFPYFRNRTTGHGGFLPLYILVVVAGFIVFLLVYKLVGTIMLEPRGGGLFTNYYYLCIPLTTGLLLFTVMDNYNTILYNASTGVLLREFGLRLMMLLALIPLVYGLINFEMFSKLYVGTFLIMAVLLTAFVIWRGECYFNLNFRNIERNMLRAMAGISIYGFLTGLASVAILQVNNIMIDLFLNEAKTGIYVTNFFFATLILLPSRGLNKIAPTMISDAFKNNQLGAISSIQVKSTINQLLIAILLFLGLYINLPNIYMILPESFSIGKWVIILTGIANVIQMSSGVGSAIIGFSRYYRYNTYLAISQIVLLILINIMVLPFWGITGAAMATLITIVLLNLAKFLIVKRKFHIQPYTKNHIIPFIIALLCLIVNELIPVQQSFILDILFRSTIIAILYVGANYLLKTSPQLNVTINNTLRRLRIR